MARLLEKEIKVRTNAAGMPLSLSRDSASEKVTAIYNQWKIEDQWWDRKIERHYFRVKTSKGVVYDIYHGIDTKQWYLSKIYD